MNTRGNAWAACLQLYDLRWEGREALLKKQQGRAEGLNRQEITLITRLQQSPEDNVKEMTLYDAKVYSACKEMAVSMNTELRSLGVPFFGTKGQLVTPKGDSTIAPSSDGTSAQGNSSDKISIAELQRLQKRMLDLLEDMCKE
ncbi:MAG: hypothetical protein M1833_003965 [Piccolia ochrophora]|nr:MAG: hypothetical protein M1833_003965 [Piccolia ochrophora]